MSNEGKKNRKENLLLFFNIYDILLPTSLDYGEYEHIIKCVIINTMR